MGKIKNMIGSKYGTFTVIERAENTKYGEAQWLCKCECGNTAVVSGRNLRDGTTKTCGANIHRKGQNLKDLTGKKFGRLTVLKRGENDKKGRVMWLCQCECGRIKAINAYSLSKGRSKSCGCLMKEEASKANKTHGLSKTRIYNIWFGIKSRCYKENSIEYNLYGGRGIKMCDEWKNSFENFCKWAYENGYSEELTIDRINVNGNYEPSNCRWATAFEQGANKRNNVVIEKDGESHILAEWSRITGIDRRKISARIFKYGWSVERALAK